MSIRGSTDHAAWRLREAAEDAAWSLDERVLQPASEVAGRALAPALAATESLQRLIQTRLAWPLADRLEDYGLAMRTGLATVAIVAAAAAGLAGTRLAAPGAERAPDGEPDLAAAALPPAAASDQTLSGVVPDFEASPEQAGQARATPVAAEAVSPAKPSVAPPPPDAPPARVAWGFAEAFVRYEVGKADERTANTFAAVADEPLAKALSQDPPRLPESAEVPEAKVLNVVLGERDGKELEVSVSLLRLKAASELRLLLRDTREGWRVAEVRG